MQLLSQGDVAKSKDHGRFLYQMLGRVCHLAV